jgi:hypothetical protein
MPSFNALKNNFEKNIIKMMRNVALLFIVTQLLSYTVNAANCAVSDYEKSDCGYVGINQSGCESKG